MHVLTCENLIVQFRAAGRVITNRSLLVLAKPIYRAIVSDLELSSLRIPK